MELKKRGLLVRMSGPPTPHVVVDCTGNWRTTCRVDKTPTLERALRIWCGIVSKDLTRSHMLASRQVSVLAL